MLLNRFLFTLLLFWFSGNGQADDSIENYINGQMNNFVGVPLLQASEKVFGSAPPEFNQYIKGLEDTFGRYEEHSIVLVKKISNRSNYIYIEMNLEKGAAYLKLLVYKEKNAQWRINLATVDKVPENVINDLDLLNCK
ncbi:hypothetical protein [Vibrio ezurae]|uniref:DUF4864 domain-containing protein n=1 Tax=Vibrio ezurae NBRC 102218 TaxID=1219080 RepID=U3AM01_9VIBR|nr:hypothetical protein [Vibrio ezurae]GAD80951.1 hypothetical protein VEZ01S_45_00870 [Vibrio ezurae NBRC 102218]